MIKVVYSVNVNEQHVLISEFAKNIRISGAYLLYDLPINLGNPTWGSITHSIHIGSHNCKLGIISTSIVQHIDASEIDIY